MRLTTPLIASALLALCCACTCECSEEESSATETPVTLPSEAEVDEIASEATDAADAVSEENADDLLGELESEVSAESDQ